VKLQRRIPITLDFDRKARQTLATSRRARSHPHSIPVSSRHALEPDALRGSIDLLILKALDLQDMHGWGIGLRIQQMSKGKLEVNQGSLYPALQRLEHKGLIDSDWQLTENNRRARYYSITAAGRRALGDEVEKWKRFAAAIQVVLAS
jgi:PadR family transcriptional regulator